MIELRDYQQAVVDLVINAYKQNQSDKVYIVLPCGAGKTICFSYIIHCLAKEERTVASMVIAHREELLDQAAEKYRFIDPDTRIGKVGGGYAEYGLPLTVASIATISRSQHLQKLTALYGTGKGLVIVIDETHHCMSARYQAVLKALPDAFVLGVTATPDRLDRKQIFDAKPPLFQISIIEMVKRQYLCNMRCVAIRTQTNLDDVKTKGGDYDERDLDIAVNTDIRNRRIVQSYIEHAPGRKAICFGVTVNHAQNLAYYFNDVGIPTACITGDTPMPERKKYYAQLAAGEIKVLTSVMVLSEGFDETSVDCVIMARPTQSRSLFVQCIGRMLRLHTGKQDAILLDITDNCLIHRLSPQNLRKSLGIHLKENETLLDALEEKEKKDEEERQERIRKLKERRPTDIHVDLLTIIQWENLPGGGWRAIVGTEKHRIAILPCKGETDLFYVAARLQPNMNTAQKWSGDCTLEECQQIAEKRILTIQNEGVHLVDVNAPWRKLPASEGQIKMLNWFNIDIPENCTRGQANELIDAHKDEIERKKKAKAEHKAAKEAQKQEEYTPGTLNGNREFNLMKR